MACAAAIAAVVASDVDAAGFCNVAARASAFARARASMSSTSGCEGGGGTRVTVVNDGGGTAL